MHNFLHYSILVIACTYTTGLKRSKRHWTSSTFLLSPSFQCPLSPSPLFFLPSHSIASFPLSFLLISLLLLQLNCLKWYSASYIVTVYSNTTFHSVYWFPYWNWYHNTLPFLPKYLTIIGGYWLVSSGFYSCYFSSDCTLWYPSLVLKRQHVSSVT